MKTQRTKAKIRQIAEAENLTIKQVEDVAFSFFRFASKKMADGDRENLIFNEIRLFKFGVFKVKESRKKYIKPRNEKPDRNKQRDTENISRSDGDKGVQENLDKGPFE